MSEQKQEVNKCGAISRSEGLRPNAVCVRPLGHSHENGLGDYHGTEQDVTVGNTGYFWHEDQPTPTVAPPAMEETAGQSAEEKVLAVWENANAWQRRAAVNPGDSLWVVFSQRHENPVPKKIIGWGATVEAAWQAAADSLTPPQPTISFLYNKAAIMPDGSLGCVSIGEFAGDRSKDLHLTVAQAKQIAAQIERIQS